MKKEPKIDILYEDNNILAINKPAGLAVHADFKSMNYTLTDWILERHPEMIEVGESSLNRPGIVHRLDADTTGVLVLAKNQQAYEYLKKIFKERKIQKVYHAIVYGHPKDDRGIIDKPIGRNKGDFRMKSTGASARGEMKEALTYYKVVDKFKDYSLVELRPKTGRTHQLRVHLKAISHPVACDSLYAKDKVCPDGMKRQALHASSIEFKLPNGGPIKIDAPLPADMDKTLAKLRG
ncbi:MAG: RluA family pseudouridine synthase [Candidatus Vogelbacteria bacterium]|nr:RluA family pseudouridine synthase [Candidatus Vogelbacteria bacterium]